MGIPLLLLGALWVVVGLVRILKTFRGGLTDRDLTGVDATRNFVQPAVWITFGLFMAFIGLANLIATWYAANPAP